MTSKNINGTKKVFKTFLKVNWLIGFVTFILVSIFYFKLPQNVPNHMDALFQIDGSGSKIMIFVIPISVFALEIVLNLSSQKYDIYFSKFNNLIKYLCILALILLWIVCLKFLIIYVQIIF
ncbi:DUF1648 domain-containing protein [Liquorilactobacillus ghanensis]|uniref:DUF1648 domain-containing protein n=1 Tax=Liquorilactobacillus ghanensis TaxID=399370 RepID=UPI0039ED4E85